MKKICLIGSIGYSDETSSGQVVRTRLLHGSLIEHYGRNSVFMVNTSEHKKYFLKILFLLLVSLFYCDIYIVILSGNGRKIVFPILVLFKKLFGKYVLNNIIGGDYDVSLNKHKSLKKQSNVFDINWVQMPSMKERITNMGICNVEVLPNSKPLAIIHNPENYIININHDTYDFCTFSRVSKEKGIELAIRAIKSINNDYRKTIARLTIYGEPDADYKQEFEKLMKNMSDDIHYGGVIELDNTINTLKNYYMLLFPTTFYGEGFPGTILDSYAAGIPVIASSWKYNPELVNNKINGLLYDYNKPELLKENIIWAICNPESVNRMRGNCTNEAKKYTFQKVMPIIFDKIDSLRAKDN